MNDPIPSRTEQIRALAWIINTIRPDWNTPGIIRVLTSSSAPIPDLAIAALLAARDRTDQHTPAIITLDGHHWKANALEPQKPTEPPPPYHQPWTPPVEEHTQTEYAAIAQRGAAKVRDAIRGTTS